MTWLDRRLVSIRDEGQHSGFHRIVEEYEVPDLIDVPYQVPVLVRTPWPRKVLAAIGWIVLGIALDRLSWML